MAPPSPFALARGGRFCAQRGAVFGGAGAAARALGPTERRPAVSPGQRVRDRPLAGGQRDWSADLEGGREGRFSQRASPEPDQDGHGKREGGEACLPPSPPPPTA